MDLWVVAAAAGAGYLAKCWQNLAREREGLAESFSGDPTYEKIEPQHSLQKLRRGQLGEDVSSGREEVLSNSDCGFSETTRLGGASVTGMASTSGFNGEASVNLGKQEDFNLFYLSSLPPWFSRRNNHQGNGDGIKGKWECDKSGVFLLSELPTGERVFCYESSRSLLRSKRSCGFSAKPLTSLESCLAAQLFKEPVEMEEYVFSSLPSQSMPTVRPLLVTDGNRIIGRACTDSYQVHCGSGEYRVHREDGDYSEEEPVLGVPPFPEIGCEEVKWKRKHKRANGRLRRLSSSNMRVSPKHFQSQGSPNGMLLFCTGITIGVMSSVKANKREVDKLNELLKQTENLVQDLQEELEMKDSLTVKELANEGYESQETNGISFHDQDPAGFSPEQELAASIKCDGKEPLYRKEDENSESLRKIEAELEAELERLELNMKASSLERRLSGLVELDSGFVADIVQGELRADMINGGAGGQDDSDQDVSGTSTTHTHTANYAVSPHELSLRLHEVIQSRLEERIMELETALERSQHQMHLMESVQINSRRDFSNSEFGSPSIFERPTIMDFSNSSLARPASDPTYNNAYEQFMRIAKPEEDLVSPEYNSNNINQVRIN